MRNRRPFNRTTVLTTVVALVSTSAIAHGQSGGDSAAAQALFDQGRRLMAEGKFDEACPKLQESQRLDPGTGTLLNLAKCHEGGGRIATAWSTYLEAASFARSVGSSDRETAARDIAASLESRVPKILITVADATRALGPEITRDGERVGEPQWGAPIPADPGRHVVGARATGYTPFRQVVQVEREGETYTVEIPALAPEGAAPEDATPAPARDDAMADRDTSRKEDGLGAQRMLALVTGGIGVVGVGLGTFFGLSSMASKSDADEVCNGAACRTDAGVEARSDAITAGNVSTIAFVVGATALAGGVVLWLTVPSEDESPSAGIAVGPGSAFVRGSF